MPTRGPLLKVLLRFIHTNQGDMMLEYLMGYVDALEKEFQEMGANNAHIQVSMIDRRYEVLLQMKKFIMDDMVPHFIDEDIRYLKQAEKPTRDRVSTIRRWEEFCDKYPDYLNKQEVKDYILVQILQEE